MHDPARTRWLFQTEFRFQGFMRIMGFPMPGMFKKASMKFMRNCKEFAESAGD